MLYIRRLKGKSLVAGKFSQTMRDMVSYFRNNIDKIVLLCHYCCQDEEGYINAMSERAMTRSVTIATREDAVKDDTLEMKRIMNKFSSGSGMDAEDWERRFRELSGGMANGVVTFGEVKGKHDANSEQAQQDIIGGLIQDACDAIDEMSDLILLWGVVPSDDPYSSDEPSDDGEDDGKDDIFNQFESAVSYFIDGFSSVIGGVVGRGVQSRMPPPGSPGWDKAIERLEREREARKRWIRMWENRRWWYTQHWFRRLWNYYQPRLYFPIWFQPWNHLIIPEPVLPCYVTWVEDHTDESGAVIMRPVIEYIPTAK